MSSGDDQRSGIAEAAEVEGGNGSFDPGPDTDYLSRPRDHELDLEKGSQPFDPGPEVKVDSRRARRAERKREKAERKERALHHRETAPDVSERLSKMGLGKVVV